MPLLDNIAWHSLSGPHRQFSSGTGTARRYAPGFSPIIGFANPAHPDFAALDRECPPGEHFYTAGLSGTVPCGWRIEAEAVMSQLVWDAPTPEANDEPALRRLGREHVPQILELTALTQPGPFAERTIELGDYFGVFEHEQLIAMAGERFIAGRLREISGVCTRPGFQGRGLARQLVGKLIRLELKRNELPFLHVRQDNERALRVYKEMGFQHYQERTLHVLSRL